MPFLFSNDLSPQAIHRIACGGVIVFRHVYQTVSQLFPFVFLTLLLFAFMFLLVFLTHQLLHDEFLLIVQAALVILDDHVVNVPLQYLGLRVQYISLL